MAEFYAKGTYSAGVNIDEITSFGAGRVNGSLATGDTPFTVWFFLVNIPMSSTRFIQFAYSDNAKQFKCRIKWDKWNSWDTFQST